MHSLKVIFVFVIVLVTQQARAGPLIGQSENDYVQPEASNLLGDVLGGVGTGLGDLAVSHRFVFVFTEFKKSL